MAANFTVTIACTICGTTQDITDVIELAKGSIDVTEPRYQCTSCNSLGAYRRCRCISYFNAYDGNSWDHCFRCKRLGEEG